MLTKRKPICLGCWTPPQTEAILDLLSDDTAVVPSLWELEVSNVLLLGERRRRFTESQTARFVALLGHTAYLVLAEREGVPLATLDTQLRNAAKAVGVQLIPERQ